MDLSKSESHSFYYYTTLQQQVFVHLFHHSWGSKSLEKRQFRTTLLIMYHFILAVAAEDDDHFLFKSNSFTIKYVTKQLSSQEGQHKYSIAKIVCFFTTSATMLRCGKLTLSRVQLSIVGNFNYTWPCLPVP